MLDKSNKRKYYEYNDTLFNFQTLLKQFADEFTLYWKPRKKFQVNDYENNSFIPLYLLMWKDIVTYPESFWFIASRVTKTRRKKVFFTKCSDHTLTAAG